jgi:ubiquinone/menaquinone biosynthesis C-methylase UbiE
MDADEFKQTQSAIWGFGDYAELGRVLRPAADALCDACAVSAGQEVLDVAAGDGNFALAAAREGAAAVASDLSPEMVERGKRRTSLEGYEVEWHQADAEALPFHDGRFDCVGSVFGAMIAPRPEVAARELFRVARPGGTVGMTAWRAEGYMGQMFEITRKYAPPSDLPKALEWGAEETVRERFGDLAGSVEFQGLAVQWEADSPEDMMAGMEESVPPQVAAKQNMDPERYSAMREELVDLMRRSGGGDGPLRIDAEYLLTVARKRG